MGSGWKANPSDIHPHSGGSFLARPSPTGQEPLLWVECGEQLILQAPSSPLWTSALHWAGIRVVMLAWSVHIFNAGSQNKDQMQNVVGICDIC